MDFSYKIFRRLRTLKFLLFFFLIFSLKIYSIERGNESFKQEIEESIPFLISEFIARGLSFPHIDTNQPFWIQIRNPEYLSDIGSFYKAYGKIILDQIEVNYFHSKLSEIRKRDFLESYLRFKFKNSANIFHSSDPVQTFFDYVDRQDLESLKKFLQENQFSETEKTLVIIFLIHTNHFWQQVLGFIEDLSLNIHQELKNETFLYERKFDFLEYGTVLTSLVHELLIAGDLDLIDQVLKHKDIDWTVRNFLGETFLHFFMRSDVLNSNRNLKLQLDLVEKLFHKLPFLFKEKDQLGLNIFMLAFDSNHFIPMKLALEFVEALPVEEQKKFFANRDNYGRSVIDILFYNGNTDKSKSGIDWPNYLLQVMESLNIDTSGILYVNESKHPQLRQINALPYIRVSSFFWPYIEYFKAKWSGKEDQSWFYMNKNFDEEVIVTEEEIEEIRDVLSEIVQKIDFLESLRQKSLSALLMEKPVLSILSAIQKKDKKALMELGEKEKEYLELFIVLNEKNQNYPYLSLIEQNESLFHNPEQASFLTHFLNEAIIYNSLPAVEYLLESYFDERWFNAFVKDFEDVEIEDVKEDSDIQFFTVRYHSEKKLNLPFLIDLSSVISEYETLKKINLPFLIDPLSLALFVYASIPPHSPQKESAKRIIQLLAKYQDPGAYSKAFIRSTPMAWALGLGLLEEVEFFHEKQGVDIPEKFFVDIDGKLIAVNTFLSLKINSFLNLKKYVAKKMKEVEYKPACKEVFLH